MLDTNCPWSVDQAIAMARRLQPFDLAWLEEPLWPPENHAGLARVRREGGVPIAAGENAAGLFDVRAMLDARRRRHHPAQRGQDRRHHRGRENCRCRGGGRRSACAALRVFRAWFSGVPASGGRTGADVPFERLFVDLEASPYHDLVDAKGGLVAVPDGPGLGRDPDLDILRRYALSAPTVLRA